jgi:hypothetical protein
LQVPGQKAEQSKASFLIPEETDQDGSAGFTLNDLPDQGTLLSQG